MRNTQRRLSGGSAVDGGRCPRVDEFPVARYRGGRMQVCATVAAKGSNDCLPVITPCTWFIEQ
jgi:hypothetical protein